MCTQTRAQKALLLTFSSCLCCRRTRTALQGERSCRPTMAEARVKVGGSSHVLSVEASRDWFGAFLPECQHWEYTMWLKRDDSVTASLTRRWFNSFTHNMGSEIYFGPLIKEYIC